MIDRTRRSYRVNLLNCDVCGKPFQAARKHATVCGVACRKRRSRLAIAAAAAAAAAKKKKKKKKAAGRSAGRR